MSANNSVLNLKKYADSVDWKLLTFLIFFLNVKLVVKIPAVILIYLFQSNFKFRFNLKNSRLPLFYPIAILIAAINWVVYGNYANINYNLVFLLGTGFWLLCILAVHQVKLAVEREALTVLHNTIWLFFMLNAAVSIFTLLGIVYETHTINPYRYQGLYQKYFIGTGDYIKGLTFDVSTTNAVLNAFGVIYFLIKKNGGMVLLCMAIMLLTGSNTINLMLAGVLMFLFIFKAKNDQKSLIMVCAMFMVIFMFKISPQNDDYIYKTYYRLVYKKPVDDRLIIIREIPLTQRPDSTLSPNEKRKKIAELFIDSIYAVNHPVVLKKQEVVGNKSVFEIAIKPVIPTPSIHTAPFQHVDDTTAERLVLLRFIANNKKSLPQSQQHDLKNPAPGKLTAIEQSLTYMKLHPQNVLTGNGVGNFSSKLAFKATGLGVAGGFPARFAYINAGFLTNHLDVYLSFFSRTAGLHSLINSPNSVYDQLFSEYGILGFLAFVIFYAGYFLKHYQYLTYGIPLLILMVGVFVIDYWFEQLSVIVFFELLMLVNIKETVPKMLSNGNS